MDFFYSEQLRQYRLQFVRAFSNFYVKFGAGTSNETLHRVPCRYGEQSRIAASVIKGNSENKLPTTPFIACYLTSINMSPERRQDPSLVERVQVNERYYDEEQQKYTNQMGNRYTVERYMPVPYNLTFEVTIWVSSIDVKEQLLEQILTLYNPAIDFQTSNNPLDWTMLSYIELLDSITWSSIAVPVGTDTAIDITSMQFKVHAWLNPPAKLKRQAIIEEIVTNIIQGSKDEADVEWTDYEFINRVVTTPGDYGIKINPVGINKYELSLVQSNGNTADADLLPTVTFSAVKPSFTPGQVLSFNGINIAITSNDIGSFINSAKAALANTNFTCELYNFNQLKFINYDGSDNVFVDITGHPTVGLGIQAAAYPGGTLAWWRLFDAYGQVREYSVYDQNASEIRLLADSPNLTWSPSDLVGRIQYHATDQNKLLWFLDTSKLPATTLNPITAVIDPTKVGPAAGLSAASLGQRYLLLSNLATSSQLWGTLNAVANDIIEYNGSHWIVSFNSRLNTTTTQVVNNLYNQRLLEWSDGAWSSFIPSSAAPGIWRIAL